MCNLLLLTFAIFWIFNLFAITSVVAQNSASEPTKNQVAFQDLLLEIGDKYDRYFTIEIEVKSEHGSNLLGIVHLPKELNSKSALKGKSLKEALRWLVTLEPNARFIIDDDPHVIHVMDSRLWLTMDYVMEKVVNRINYDGRLFDLPTAIGGKGFAITSKRFGDTRDLATSDYRTDVHVNEKHRKVRDILTKSLKLKGRGRILWIAETDFGASSITYVRFLL